MIDIISLKTFFVDKQYLTLLYTTLTFFSIALITWIMYISLSKRDLFHLEIADYFSKSKIRLYKLSYTLKYLILFPLFTFIWFLIFAFSLAILSKDYKIADIFFFSIVLVSVIRVASYISEKFSEDLAKLLPLTLISILLLNPTSITFITIKSTAVLFSKELPSTIKYLLFAVMIEWLLRLCSAIYHYIQKLRVEKQIDKNKII
ncbi:hypothetical protein J4232_05715 [Candidatus Woesearchaeota archaeon]|nr:hypothetical protein [Candidatus Woesearchaeota archaeon]